MNIALHPKGRRSISVHVPLWNEAMKAVGGAGKMSARIDLFLRTLINSPKGKKLGAKIPAHLVKEGK